MVRHPGSSAGAAGDDAVNAKGAKLSGIAEEGWGDLRSLGDGFGVRDSPSRVSRLRGHRAGSSGHHGDTL
jgi:hypothetical protein